MRQPPRLSALLPAIVTWWSNLAGRDRRRLWFALACSVVLAYEVYALFVREVGPRHYVHGQKRIVLRDAGQGERITQSFIGTMELLDGVTLWFEAPDDRVVANVRCSLNIDAGPGLTPLYRWVERIDVRGRQPHTFRFVAVSPARGRLFRFDLQLERPTASPLGIEASVDNPLPSGALTIGGRERWGDLVFRTRSATKYRRFLATARGLPKPLRSTALHVALFALYNWALMTFVYYMVVADEEEWEGRSS